MLRNFSRRLRFPNVVCLMNESLWYQNAVFYELYVRAFCDSNADGHGDLPGLTSKLDYLQDLGVDCLWLLPIYSSPLLDDGYDIADYYSILREYGTLGHFKRLVEAVHARGMRIITDLVLNHTSDQHPWFQAARADRTSPYRDYYVWSDTDQKYSDARVIFLDTERSNWSWDEQAGQYYWHRFYASQPDLNYANPRVRKEMIKVMKFWLDMGIDGFRADAVPYLFEREGTNCENLPETHEYLKRIRRFMDENYPGRILLAEANQWPEDVRPYFGEGDEFHMGFHFPVMPRIYMALRQGNRQPIQWILERTPTIPRNCQWCTFLRNHDELTLEMVTEQEREWMWQEYAPDPRMRLNLGIRRRLAPLLENDRRKIELAYSLLFTLPGSPVLYYGDEIGMGDNIWLPDRNGVRTPMQWDPSVGAGFSTATLESLFAPVNDSHPYDPGNVNVAAQCADPKSLLQMVKHMIAVRKAHKAFGLGDLIWEESYQQSVAVYWRVYQGEEILIVNNLSPEAQTVILPPKIRSIDSLLVYQPTAPASSAQNSQLQLKLAPFQFLWLKG
ncbi:MAG: maltose alpha-D-glucosyltransferase [Anaerolineales bacterium]|nr:maltose alpha-D-glucosyltransferase [Anaerolineales bacterium]